MKAACRGQAWAQANSTCRRVLKTPCCLCPLPIPPSHVQASLAVHKVMAELKLLDGPLGHLEIGQRIGAGGFGVVHAGEG